MRDRLTELCDRKISEMHFVNSDHWFDFSQKINEIVDYLLENGVVVIDADVVSPENRPLISQYMGRPIDEVINLIRRSEWISVDERLPPPNKECLVAAKVGEEMVVDLGEIIRSYSSLTNTAIDTWEIYNDWDEGQGCKITHWMPLPEPPKMKCGAE